MSNWTWPRLPKRKSTVARRVYTLTQIRSLEQGQDDPILPGLGAYLGRIRLVNDIEQPELDEASIKWTIHADNAPPREGKTRLRDIEIEHLRDVDS